MSRLSGAAVCLVLGVAIASSGTAAAENRSNDFLLAQSELGRALWLGRVVGDGCSADSVFYGGRGTRGAAKDFGFWSVSCSSGKSYMVEVHPNGSSSVLSCAIMEAIKAGRCFVHIPGAAR